MPSGSSTSSSNRSTPSICRGASLTVTTTPLDSARWERWNPAPTTARTHAGHAGVTKLPAAAMTSIDSGSSVIAVQTSQIVGHRAFA